MLPFKAYFIHFSIIQWYVLWQTIEWENIIECEKEYTNAIHILSMVSFDNHPEVTLSFKWYKTEEWVTFTFSIVMTYVGPRELSHE